jgi:hypothetical protein
MGAARRVPGPAMATAVYGRAKVAAPCQFPGPAKLKGVAGTVAATEDGVDSGTEAGASVYLERPENQSPSRNADIAESAPECQTASAFLSPLIDRAYCTNHQSPITAHC